MHIMCKHKNVGSVLFEIIIALSVAVLFVSVLSNIFLDSQDIFESSKIKNSLLDLFVINGGVEDISLATTSIDIHYSRSELGNSFSVKNYFYKNNGLLSFLHMNENLDSMYSSDKICSSYIAKKRVVGSYEYFHYLGKRLYPSEVLNIEDINVLPMSLPVVDPVTDFIVSNNLLFVSTDTNRQSDTDLYLFDVSDFLHPILLSEINNGPGISDIYLYKDRVYVANASTVNQVDIINIGQNKKLYIEDRYALLPPTASSTLPKASEVFFDGGYIYLGTEKWDGDEFSIIDVSSYSDPVIVYSYNTDSKVNNIEKYSNNIVVSSSGYEQLIVFGLDEGGNVSTNSYLSPSGWSRQEGKVTNVFRDSILFGRTVGGFNIQKDHELFSIKIDPSSTDSSLYVDTSLDIPGGVYGLVEDEDFVYMGTRENGKEFAILPKDLSTTTALYLDMPIGVDKMKCYRDSIYILGYDVSIIYKLSFK